MHEQSDAALIDALQTLGPQGRLPGRLLFASSALAGAGLDVADVDRWAQQHGGGAVDAGAVKLRKGQRPEHGQVGRPEAFVLVPEAALTPPSSHRS
jgi:hypothetical protein